MGKGNKGSGRVPSDRGQLQLSQVCTSETENRSNTKDGLMEIRHRVIQKPSQGKRCVKNLRGKTHQPTQTIQTRVREADGHHTIQTQTRFHPRWRHPVQLSRVEEGKPLKASVRGQYIITASNTKISIVYKPGLQRRLSHRLSITDGRSTPNVNKSIMYKPGLQRRLSHRLSITDERSTPNVNKSIMYIQNPACKGG